MFTIECTYQPSASGLIFLPNDAGGAYRCDLHVHFEPLARYRAEPDVGAGVSYEVGIASVEMLDHRDRKVADKARILRGSALKAARAFLDRYCPDEMWSQADSEAAYHFDGSGRWAA